MATTRPATALASSRLRFARSSIGRAAPIDPRRFGKRAPVHGEAQALPASNAHDDLRLFAATFAAGFLFVSVLIV
ncbi:hypothetical protein [Sphingomonas sp.]|uniref:hypothetical protein n=1 Tax=Sphingomonas sp. TaxID=28214 RepID=UPI001801B84A|nr:hypothetical protein [Sphingomonas sp.]MBA3512232.1 hypothetical protein [Sphingomonas sp.]